jgi:hypothetical protein
VLSISNPSNSGGIGSRISVQGWLQVKTQVLILKTTTAKHAWEHGSSDRVPMKCQDLSSNSSTANKQMNKKKNQYQFHSFMKQHNFILLYG